MVLPALPLRFDAILQLQGQLDRFLPGSHDYEVADLACSFALNAERTTENSQYFVRNLVRDAKKTLRRRSLAKRSAPVVSGDQEAGDFLSFALASNASLEPHEYVCATELEKELRMLILNIRGATRCLEGLLLNEPPSETALSMGVPVHRINHLRTVIRKKLIQLMSRERADNN